MKSHLVTTVLAFAAGAAVSFVAVNIILPAIEDFSIKTIDINSAATLSDPNIEVFNYRAINPTVEVYIGDDCEVHDGNGNCIDDVINPEPTPEENPEENQNGATD